MPLAYIYTSYAHEETVQEPHQQMAKGHIRTLVVGLMVG